jgi:UDP-3-O-[3-hydroxymyristoyl] glucosamine N-acyltransferase
MQPITLSKIQALANAQLFGNASHEIHEIKTIRDLKAGSDNSRYLTWVADKNVATFNTTIQPGLLILSPTAYQKLPNGALNFLVTTNPRRTFFKILEHCYPPKHKTGISPTAIISPTAKIGANCYIGHHVIIDDDVSIGDSCSILHNTVILSNTKIGNNVMIGCNCTIGNDGFGYEKDDQGIFKPLLHIGNVIIEDNVNIHNNCCVDRAVIGSTVIGKEVKFDNLIQIAHGVKIGYNSLVMANAMIAGSTEIGDNCWISPSASINNGLKIAEENLIGTGAVVVRNTEPGKVYAGNPATEIYLLHKLGG